MTATTICLWLVVLFGWFQNLIYLPRREHRVLSARLDSLNLRQRKAYTPLNNDDIGFHGFGF